MLLRFSRRLILAIAVTLGIARGLLADSTPPVLIQTIPDQSFTGTTTPISINLTQFIQNQEVTGTAVRISVRIGTEGSGNIDLGLFDQQTPLTVANFLHYITSNVTGTTSSLFTDNIIHRSLPGFIIQGGEYFFANATSLDLVQTFPAVQNEPGISNVAGTIAMAKLPTDPNSATSQWFINLVDNSSNLDNQNGGFTVFGQILGNGLTVANQIAALNTYDESSTLAADLTNLPLTNSTLSVNNFVLTSMSVIPSISFTVSSGNPTLVTTNISGNTLTLTPLGKASGQANITVTATNLDAGQLQTVFGVDVSAPQAPKINTQPVATSTVASGGSVTFSVSVSGSPAPTFQWMFGTTVLTGQTGSSLTLNQVSSANAGNYTVVITNSLGKVTSTAAKLVVIFPPSITKNPANQSVVAGAVASFTVSASGNPAPTFQWQVSSDAGNTWGNITGGTASTFAVATTLALNGNQYRCVASNGMGSPATSTAATLTVNQAPKITSQPVATTTVTAGGSATFTVVATGFPAPTFQWMFGTTTLTGQSGSSLTLNQVSPSNAGNYTVVITNSLGKVTSSAAKLVVDFAPTITTNPINKSVLAGAAAAFTVAASGNPTPTFQWQVSVDGGNTWNNVTTGGTLATLTVVTTFAMNGNEYRCVASNGIGSPATSNSATLTVTQAPKITTQPVASTTVTAGGSATFSVAGTGNPTPTFQWMFGTTVLTGQTGSSLTLNQVSSANAGNYTVVVTNSLGKVTSSAAKLVVDFAPTITTNPINKSVLAGTAVAFTVAASGNPTPTFQWQVSVDGGNTWNNVTTGGTLATLTVVTTFAMNGNEYRCVASNGIGSPATSNAATLTVTQAPKITTQPVASTTVTAGGSATFSVAGTGNPTPTFQWMFGTTALTGQTGSSLTLNQVSSANAGNYTVVVTNSLGKVTSTAAKLVVDFAPTITTNPINKSVLAGTAAAFTVAASGNPTPTFQWQVSVDGGNTWNNVTTGGTLATLTVVTTFAMNGNEYRCVASNGIGSPATSNAATLTVTQAPKITVQPAASTIVPAGNSVTLSVVATGNPVPTYQWMFGTTALAGQTGSSHTINSVQSSNAGTYTVVITNSLGKVTSTAAKLEVTPALPSA